MFNKICELESQIANINSALIEAGSLENFEDVALYESALKDAKSELATLRKDWEDMPEEYPLVYSC
jgi:hypothetical protein|nr:MAG TPA: endonuclease [Caudoviricetes sp.]